MQLVASVLSGAIKDVKKGKIPKKIHLDDFLSNLKSTVGNLPFSKDAIAMYYCMKDSETPTYVKGIIAAALAYLFLPEDAIPDWIAGLGFTDDLVVMTTALAAISGNITEEHRQKAEEFFEA
ncbi:YkvA family protein [Floridanema evergladense]|uniref:YkvA family protein n=1 Tax=Floridaenema evergladense BLCC-F167 TaxID=3153639 RepID=A0ABV4WWM8_9CYAN